MEMRISNDFQLQCSLVKKRLNKTLLQPSTTSGRCPLLSKGHTRPFFNFQTMTSALTGGLAGVAVDHQLLVHGFLHWKRDIAILWAWPQFGFHVRVEGCICQHLPGLTTARTLSFLRVEKGRHWTPTLHTFSMG